MEQKRFDALSRLVGAKSSRRGAFAGFVGAALLAQPAPEADAQCRGKKGKNKRQCRRRHHEGQPPGASGTCGRAGDLCGDLLGVECCGPFKCTTTLAVVSNCVLPCEKDEECRKQFIYNQVACQEDALYCPFIKGGKCCQPKTCSRDDDCNSGYFCRHGYCKV
ncbi:MAG: hypothetical protein U0031_01515 [Thermomicrobiales bacterium]